LKAAAPSGKTSIADRCKLSAIEPQDHSSFGESAYVLLSQPNGEKKITLGEGYMWKIGRHEENAVVIHSDVVSRQHAIIQRAEDGKYYLIDMGSRNGSFVNGRRVSVPVSLHNGDKISVGDGELIFHRTADKPITATRPVESPEATRALYASSPTTVLAVDIRNFTVLTQKIDQSLLCQVIGTFFREGGLILQAQGSWAQKYIGDAIMSVWIHRGGNQPQDLLGIVQAIVKLAAMTATLQAKFKLADPIRIGAGLNTGIATIGNTGSGQLNDYTALGDTVNAAFRFETATKETGVDLLMGDRTYESLCKSSSPQAFFTQHTVHLKGYEGDAHLWGTKFSKLEAFAKTLPATAPEPVNPASDGEQTKLP
jgi:adenylate cyclase